MSDGERRTCVSCAGKFILAPGELNFYSRSLLELPKRCPTCRRARRLLKLEDQDRPVTAFVFGHNGRRARKDRVQAW